MEGEETNLMRKREARRQRILQNAQRRFNKLKGVEHKEAAAVSEGGANNDDDDKGPSTVVKSNKAAGNPLVLLLSYKPPDNIVNLRLVIITLLAILLSLHNHWQLFGSREISLVTAFLGLEAQYVLAAYSLGWLVACTSNEQLTNHSTMVTTISSLLHLPTALIALAYCLVTLVIQVVTDFFWYLFIVTCTISLDILIM